MVAVKEEEDRGKGQTSTHPEARERRLTIHQFYREASTRAVNASLEENTDS
jgi:hypothetical protein